MWPFKKKLVVANHNDQETRSSGGGYTAQVMQARADFISGTEGIAEITGTVQSAVTLWEGGLSLADVDGTDLVTPFHLALAARALALRGEAVFLIQEDGLVPCADWDLRTRQGRPTAYRVSVSEAGGGWTQTALAAEVMHFRIGGDMVSPWTGIAPLRRAQLTAGLLQTVETALSEVYANAPLGSAVIPFPEAPDQDMGDLARGFRGFRGKVLVRESVNVTAAGAAAPQTDLKANDVTPDLSKAMTRETLAAARASIEMVFGILPGMTAAAATGPMVREGQRHLATWVLQPIARMIAQEASEKLGQPVALDTLRPLQAFDTSGRARAMSGIIQALALAKESGVDPAQALKLVDWSND